MEAMYTFGRAIQTYSLLVSAPSLTSTTKKHFFFFNRSWGDNKYSLRNFLLLMKILSSNILFFLYLKFCLITQMF